MDERQIDEAARLIERLLADRQLRAAFRKDPPAACRDAGFEAFADEMARGAYGKAAHTLEVRQSRSSLAGVMMALAIEGIGVVDLAHDIAPVATGPVGDVLSRVNLPQVEPAPTAARPAGDASAADAAPADGAVDASAAGGAAAQAPDPSALALLDNDNVVLNPVAVAEIKSGRVDPRVVSLLTSLSERHEVTVSRLGSVTPAGAATSGADATGVDIAAIDGARVNAANPIAREVATSLSSLDPRVRPDEIATPWSISGPGYVTDVEHADHLRIAFKEAVDAAWVAPPQEVTTRAFRSIEPAARTAPRATASSPAVDAVAAPAAGAQAPAGPAGAASFDELVGPQAAARLAAADVRQPAGAKALGALAEALKYKGTPYLWGGETPATGFDCSGLLQWSYAQQDIAIARVTYDQVKQGTHIERADLRPGDLVFFQDETGDIHHAGMSMGGDRFLHAPHTGDVVKISSLDEPYYARQFLGGRRFDDGAIQAPAPPAGGDARRSDSVELAALSAEQVRDRSATIDVLPALPAQDDGAPPPAPAADAPPVAADPGAAADALAYPGDDAPKERIAAWMAAHAQRAGLPPELPVMAALVESGLFNNPGGDRDSVGYFQMRLQYWNSGAYAGYPDDPNLQVKWFVDQALAIRERRLAGGNAGFGSDPSAWGEWIADVERPAEQYRGRYQTRLAEARALLGTG